MQACYNRFMENTKIYTLKALADKEKTSYGVVRNTLVRLAKKPERPIIWRGYEFIQPGGVQWFAYEVGAPVEFVS